MFFYLKSGKLRSREVDPLAPNHTASPQWRWMCIHISLPSPKSCPWLQKKRWLLYICVCVCVWWGVGMTANPSALAASPEASLGMSVPEGQSTTWQLGDRRARPCQRVQWKPSLLSTEVGLSTGWGLDVGTHFFPSTSVDFLLPS